MVSSSVLPRPHPAVVFRTVTDGAVLLHMEDEIYFGLNPVGASIWELLPPTCSDLDDLCTRLIEKYPDVDSAVLRQDVVELLAQLQESRLVVSPV